MVSVLTKIFGSAHVQLAEDVVQDALLTAMENWKYNGLPDNPGAWLYRVAKNKAIDIIRRKKHTQTFDFSDPSHQLLNSEYTLQYTMENFWAEEHIRNDFLAMMYACCHPGISQENQITFILKALCGFSVKEIARAFITSEDTIAKRLYRTKELFRTYKIPLKIPVESEITSRTNSVLNAIYLIFNEGYNSTHNEELIRSDIIEQALVLCKALTENDRTRLAEVYALMALICFHTARSSGRLSKQGELILLADQDRSQWDKELIMRANDYLNQSAFGSKISTFHLEAAIAYEHCMAHDYAATNWHAILNYYNQLAVMTGDKIVLLNRCIVIMEVHGPQKALQALNEIDDISHLQNYYLYYALLARLHQQTGNTELAVKNFALARKLTRSPREKEFLTRRILELPHDKN